MNEKSLINRDSSFKSMVALTAVSAASALVSICAVWLCCFSRVDVEPLYSEGILADERSVAGQSALFDSKGRKRVSWNPGGIGSDPAIELFAASGDKIASLVLVSSHEGIPSDDSLLELISSRGDKYTRIRVDSESLGLTLSEHGAGPVCEWVLTPSLLSILWQNGLNPASAALSARYGLDVEAGILRARYRGGQQNDFNQVRGDYVIELESLEKK